MPGPLNCDRPAAPAVMRMPSKVNVAPSSVLIELEIPPLSMWYIRTRPSGSRRMRLWPLPFGSRLPGSIVNVRPSVEIALR